MERRSSILEPVTVPNSPSYEPSIPDTPEGFVAPSNIADSNTKEEFHHYSHLSMASENESLR